MSHPHSLVWAEFLQVELESFGGGLLIHARPDFRLLDLPSELVVVIPLQQAGFLGQEKLAFCRQLFGGRSSLLPCNWRKVIIDGQSGAYNIDKICILCVKCVCTSVSSPSARTWSSFA